MFYRPFASGPNKKNNDSPTIPDWGKLQNLWPTEPPEKQPLDKNEARRLAYQQGLTDGQIAHVVTQATTSARSIEALVKELDRSLQHVDMTHLGVATIRKNKVVTTALILSRRLVKLSPLRSFSQAQKTVYLRGRFFERGSASEVKRHTSH